MLYSHTPCVTWTEVRYHPVPRSRPQLPHPEHLPLRWFRRRSVSLRGVGRTGQRCGQLCSVRGPAGPLARRRPACRCRPACRATAAPRPRPLHDEPQPWDRPRKADRRIRRARGSSVPRSRTALRATKPDPRSATHIERPPRPRHLPRGQHAEALHTHIHVAIIQSPRRPALTAYSNTTSTALCSRASRPYHRV